MADIRVLLHGLADEVGTVTAPPDLALRGRRRLRTRRVIASATAAVAAGAVGLATLLVPHSTTAKPVVPTDEGTAAEIAKGHWSIGDRAAPDRTVSAKLIWTGDDVIAIGGTEKATSVRQTYAWSPASRSWRALAEAPATIGLGDGASVWTGSRLLVMPGYDGDAQIPAAERALLYDPGANRWSETAPLPHRVSANGSWATWNGSEVFVAGAADNRLFGESYDPTTDRWTDRTPTTPADHDVQQVSAIQTPKGLLLWSFWSHAVSTGNHGDTSISAGIDVYRDRGDGWQDITAQWPRNLWSNAPLMVGDDLEVRTDHRWCGPCSGPVILDQPAVLVDLSTFATTQLPANPVDGRSSDHVWTGSAEIVTTSFGKIAVRDPATGWTDLPTSPSYLGYYGGVWTGREYVTQTDDGRIATFGSTPAVGLPGCPANWSPPTSAVVKSARIDADGITAAEVCTYTLRSQSSWAYEHPLRHSVDEEQLAALVAGMRAAEPANFQAASCSGNKSPTAQVVYLLQRGDVRVLSRGGAGCLPFLAEGGAFTGSALYDAVVAIIG